MDLARNITAVACLLGIAVGCWLIHASLAFIVPSAIVLGIMVVSRWQGLDSEEVESDSAKLPIQPERKT